MVIDSSAFVSIVLLEDDAEVLLGKIVSADVLKTSAASLMEASMVLLSRGGQLKVEAFDALLLAYDVEVLPVDRAQALIARDAFARFGKGRDPAGLNFGDCFSYALAWQTGEPLLFKGNDFSQTDLAQA
jgi:ribonuclease VapC